VGAVFCWRQRWRQVDPTATRATFLRSIAGLAVVGELPQLNQLPVPPSSCSVVRQRPAASEEDTRCEP